MEPGFLLYVVGDAAENVSSVSVDKCVFLASCFEESEVFAVVLCSDLEDCVMCVAEMLLAGVEIVFASILDVSTLRVMKIRLDAGKPVTSIDVDDYLNAKKLKIVCKDVGECLKVVKMLTPSCIKYARVFRSKEVVITTIELGSDCGKELHEAVKQLRKIQVENILNGLCKPTTSIHIENRQANTIPLKFSM